jgi:fructose-bisphosphate aldolase / 6-deoxy-5-ketofructose 1-phosphate synthase
MQSFTIPADVPVSAYREFRKNYTLLTHATGNLFLFAADHKIEHLDADFHGPHVHKAAHDPHHLFSLAQQSPSGGMATQLGLIAQYGLHYPSVTYVAKLSSKTNIIPLSQKEPFSPLLWTVDDVIAFKKSSNLTIAGIGITVYLGSYFEDRMLEQAAQTIFQAHQQGLVAIVWMYPRGKAVLDATDPHLIAGAVGVAASLGADFVKIHPPHSTNASTADLLRSIVEAAGNTKVICAGGTYTEKEALLEKIHTYMASGVAGVAIGRSLFQHSLPDAVSLAKKIAQLVYRDIKQ